MNILNLIQSQFTPQTISQISNAVGESPEGTKSAIGTAVPALLGSLMGKVNASPDGATQVFNLIKQQGQSQGGWFDSISSLFSGGQSQPAGASIVTSLLGSKLGVVSDFISGHSSIKSSSATSILGMAAPLLIGIIGKHAASQGLGAAGLGQLINSQGESLKDSIPSGLANTLGIGNLLGSPSGTTKIPTATVAPEPQATYRGETYARPATVGAGAPAYQARHSSPLKWVVPLLAVVALGLWALIQKSSKEPVGGPMDTMQTQVGRSPATPDLSTLNLPPGSLADQVAKTISSGNLSQPIELTGINFDSNGQLNTSANGQIREIGSVLKAVPNLRASITGYGTTQDEGASRANSIKSILVSAGASTDHVMTTGQAGTGTPSIQLMR